MKPLEGQAALSADVGRAESLARASRGEARGNEVARGFEALLLKRLVGAMRKTVPDSGLLPSSAGSQMYDHLIEQALADHLAQGDVLRLEPLFARATGEAADAPLRTAPNRTSFRANAPEPARISAHTRDEAAPLASTLPPQEDAWLDSPGAELKLRRLLLEGASSTKQGTGL